MLSRRDVGKLAVGALAMPAIGAKKIDSVVHGVQFGLQSYIFTGIGLPQEGLVEVVIRSMAETRLGRVRSLCASGGAGAILGPYAGGGRGCARPGP